MVPGAAIEGRKCDRIFSDQFSNVFRSHFEADGSTLEAFWDQFSKKNHTKSGQTAVLGGAARMLARTHLPAADVAAAVAAAAVNAVAVAAAVAAAVAVVVVKHHRS